ncbi:hypothetical protein CYMTET_33419 [Cymbomonas tetramitiformis]|uniref:Uncharacterized protein n=1 Tax=Cymbomonas tetramitiformis TaxID=36881 RepID=A0AAE0FD60_9CHLO|nr:hypothetical protein CYMTET_39169 [Cymbomonas tetramitiformis]KAK3257498.1 hypothetical protein CYMTET_33419 [Cymbomonas tetramitiformis]
MPASQRKSSGPDNLPASSTPLKKPPLKGRSTGRHDSDCWWKALIAVVVVVGIGLYLEYSRTDEPIPGLRKRVQGGTALDAYERAQNVLVEHHKGLVDEVSGFVGGKHYRSFRQVWKNMDKETRMDLVAKARALLSTDQLLNAAIEHSRDPKKMQQMEQVTLKMFAPEIFADEALATEDDGIPFLLDVVVQGKEHDYYGQKRPAEDDEDEEYDEDEDDRKTVPGIESSPPDHASQEDEVVQAAAATPGISDPAATESQDQDPQSASSGDATADGTASDGSVEEDESSETWTRPDRTSNEVDPRWEAMWKQYRSVALASFAQKIILAWRTSY